MKKVATILGAGALLLSSLTSAMAGGLGAGVGVMGVLAESEGTETLKTTSVKTTKKGVNGHGVAASYYIQYMINPWSDDNGLVVGYESIPGSASLGKKDFHRIDIIGANLTRTVRQQVEAKIEGHQGWYIETPTLFGFFLRGGMSSADIKTTETLGTGASYGDTSIDGESVGIGFRSTFDSKLHLKFLVENTRYDEFTLTSTGSDAASTIKADIETWDARVSVGLQF